MMSIVIDLLPASIEDEQLSLRLCGGVPEPYYCGDETQLERWAMRRICAQTGQSFRRPERYSPLADLE
ncbi:MAG: hypothetical protein M3O62_09505 [Pseudomonadota bacterium]|nr:hypothetical protein [Pseudomonadota bacterium]